MSTRLRGQKKCGSDTFTGRANASFSVRLSTLARSSYKSSNSKTHASFKCLRSHRSSRIFAPMLLMSSVSAMALPKKWHQRPHVRPDVAN